MSSSYDAKAAAEARRRMMEETADAAIRRVRQAAKPTLKRYTWSRLHTDLLDDNRWALVAHRAQAPLPIVEALVIRLEVEANKSQPRGFIGDFNAEAMAVRWGVDVEMVLRIFDELERPDIGWIQQDTLVTFWARNPDRVDETAAERKRRQRARQKAGKLLAAWARQGLISDALRRERELAMNEEGCDVEALVGQWKRSVTSSVTVTRDTVTVTPRAEQIINQERPRAAPVATLGANLAPVDPTAFADRAKALQWLKGDGEALVTGRLGGLRSKACKTIARWSVTACHDVTGLAGIIHASLSTAAQGEAFRKLVEDQVARRAAELIAPALPLPPVSLKGGKT